MTKLKLVHPPQPTPLHSDEVLRKLINMTKSTNLVALDKTLSAIFNPNRSRENKWRRVGDIADRIVRAAHEVSMCLEPNQRARKEQDD